MTSGPQAALLDLVARRRLELRTFSPRPEYANRYKVGSFADAQIVSSDWLTLNSLKIPKAKDKGQWGSRFGH